MAQTVLETVLDQLGMSPAEYFQRLSQSLDEAREQRLHRVSTSRETDAFIQEEAAAPELSLIGDEPDSGFGFSEVTEEEPLAPPTIGAARARPRKPARARAPRPAEEGEDELAEFGLEPLEEDESQFRQAYRRAMRTQRRPFRER